MQNAEYPSRARKVSGVNGKHDASASMPLPPLATSRFVRGSDRYALKWLGICLLNLFIVCVTSLRAHEVPDGEYERLITVELKEDGVEITYRLEIDKLTLFRVVPKIDGVRVHQLKKESDFAQAFLDRLKKIVPDHLTTLFNNQEVQLKVSKRSRFDSLDSMQFRIFLSGSWKANPSKNQFQLIENNTYHEFPVQKGRLRLTLDTKLDLKEIYEPREIRFNAAEIAEKDRMVSAVFGVSETHLEDVKEPIKETESTPSSVPEEPKSLYQEVKEKGLNVLFNSGWGLTAVLFVAALFGAAHALTPGHGKTMVAAYLVGERGTVFHAIILGLIVTLTHTGAVILLAWGLYEFLPTTSAKTAAAAVGLIGGLLIFAVGMWMLLRRISGKADHVHLFGDGHGHSHSHGGHEHSHSHGEKESHSHGKEGLGRSGWIRLVLLGISGGMIPCTDAIVLLMFAISSQQLWIGVPLLLAFSAGLAAVLVAIGIGVVVAARMGARQFKERRWFKALPIISSIIVVIIGLWMCADSVSDMGIGGPK